MVIFGGCDVFFVLLLSWWRFCVDCVFCGGGGGICVMLRIGYSCTFWLYFVVVQLNF